MPIIRIGNNLEHIKKIGFSGFNVYTYDAVVAQALCVEFQWFTDSMTEFKGIMAWLGHDVPKVSIPNNVDYFLFLPDGDIKVMGSTEIDVTYKDSAWTIFIIPFKVFMEFNQDYIRNHIKQKKRKWDYS